MGVGARATLVAVLVTLLVSALSGSAAPAGSGHRAGPPAPPGALASPEVASYRSARDYASVPVPVRVRVPAAGVDSALQPLGRNPDGTIAVPDNPDVAGWFSEGPRPGQPGPSVILGHVDSTKGPAVFFNVSRLSPGAEIWVDGADGSSRAFRVTGVTRVAKTEFPTDLVYLPTLQPTLRLVTCGGTFDRTAGSYRDNVIVFAVPA